MAKNTEISRHKLSMAEVITILITFHLGGFRNLKHYYEFYVKKHLSKYFPKTVSYNRFVELQQSVLFVMTLFLKIAKLGKDTGIAFVDSTPLRICKNKRIPNSIRNTKTFTNIAARGKSTMGYFYGFKLHLIINEMGEILNFVIIPFSAKIAFFHQVWRSIVGNHAFPHLVQKFKTFYNNMRLLTFHSVKYSLQY